MLALSDLSKNLKKNQTVANVRKQLAANGALATAHTSWHPRWEKAAFAHHDIAADVAIVAFLAVINR